MSWIAPVTNRTSAQGRTTYEDMNRICGNLNYLFGTALRTNWTRADIVDRATWDSIISVVAQVAESVGVQVSDSTDYVNLNAIEEATLRQYVLTYASYKLPVRFNGVQLGERAPSYIVIVKFKTPIKFGGVQF